MQEHLLAGVAFLRGILYNKSSILCTAGGRNVKKILDLIADEMKRAFAECGYGESYAKVVLSNRPDLCEYQCNGAMAAAKMYKKKPIDIASQVVEYLEKCQESQTEAGLSRMFCEVNAVMPGFINLRLDTGYLADYMNGMQKEEKLGLEEPGHGETIIVDYGGANVAKPLHVGHLRSAVIGECIKRLGAWLGYHTVGDVHLGDWGLQMGLIIEELRERKPELVYFDEAYTGEYPKEPPFTISELEDIYPAASARSKEDGEFKARAQAATLRLQSGYAPFMAIWKHIMAVSLADLRKNYENLDVHFDLWKGESDAQPYIPWLLQDLQDKGLAYESEGALVVDIAEPGDTKELPPCIVRKSDGAALYATSDIGTILDREKKLAPDWYIYIADKRQELHYTQFFRVARKAGYVKDGVPMVFIGFGTMNGKDGRPFKTREGGVMRLEHLIEDINEAVYARIMKNETIPETEAQKTAKIIGLAALKYGDLANQASKDYVFDVDRFTSFEGNTGPYILYTIVRIKSILAKYEALEEKYDGQAVILPAAGSTEKALMLELANYNDMMERAFTELAPHRICQFIYNLSDAFSSFYDNNKIISEEDKLRQAGWIRLITLVKDVLTACIHVLGFEAPERM